MSRGAKSILILLILTVAVCAALLLLRNRGGDQKIARITLDGEVIEEIDLEKLEEPWTRTVTGPGGFPNTIRAEHGRICVEEAGCPDQICVRMGYIEDSTIPIVCLPNHLIIEILGGGSDLDAAAG